MTLSDRYRRWFEYEKDSHAKVLDSLNATPQDLSIHPSFRKAVDLLAHIVAARRLWLFRLGVLDEGPTDIFPQGVQLSNLGAQLDQMHSEWTFFMDGLTDDELGRKFEYRSLEGESFRNTVEDILTQLFGHSWYHRGQIATLLRAIGAEPAVTDFVFWCREPIDGCR
jgi:uncharacterized damage-inducible protein DinB